MPAVPHEARSDVLKSRYKEWGNDMISNRKEDRILIMSGFSDVSDLQDVMLLYFFIERGPMDSQSFRCPNFITPHRPQGVHNDFPF